MRISRAMARRVTLRVTLCWFAACGAAHAAELPPHLQSLVGTPPHSAADVATQNVLALNRAMFELYGDAAKTFAANLRARHPIILALFSGSGGRLILYRPGQAPLEAPPVPMVYQLMKSAGHSAMAVSEVVLPYVDNRSDASWRAPLAAYRMRMQLALDTLDAAPMPPEWRENTRAILRNNIAFMDECATRGVIGLDAVQAYATKQAPFLRREVAWAAQTQVAHWMGVMDEWKRLIGADWDKTYAASNTIYVARQNNVLYSVLAQYFGPDALNVRLMLIETISFTTTPEDMMESVTRIVADRSVGQLFFGNYHLMDYELMGTDARTAIAAEAGRRGMTPFLPPKVPFGSTQWPMLITPGPGPATLDDLH
jgi:hypothetical protein